MNKLFSSLAAPVIAAASLCRVGPALAQEPASDVKAKVAMCIGCHGISGYQASYPEIHKVPMISGQSERFLVASLNAYKTGERKHPTMRSLAESLSDKDIAEIAAYYAKDGGPSQAPAQVPAPSQHVGALLVKGACASCHGTNYSRPIDPSYPKLAGQYADYLYVALKSYQVGRNPIIGRTNAIMGAQVRPFSSNELKAMADYLASLPGELKTVPQPPLR